MNLISCALFWLWFWLLLRPQSQCWCDTSKTRVVKSSIGTPTLYLGEVEVVSEILCEIVEGKLALLLPQSFIFYIYNEMPFHLSFIYSHFPNLVPVDLVSFWLYDFLTVWYEHLWKFFKQEEFSTCVRLLFGCATSVNFL